MVWDKTRKGILDVEGEQIGFEIRVPSALDVEDVLSYVDENGKVLIKDSEIVRKFLLSIDGFPSVDEFLSSPQTFFCMKAIAGYVVASSTLKAELKN